MCRRGSLYATPRTARLRRRSYCWQKGRPHRMAYDRTHYSPVFANEQWASNSQGKRYTCYYRNERARQVTTSNPGRRQWGRRRKLWSRRVELALNRELKSPV